MLSIELTDPLNVQVIYTNITTAVLVIQLIKEKSIYFQTEGEMN